MRLSPDQLERAACIGHDPELWFSTQPEQQATAIQICRGCPLIADCSEIASTRPERHGIWAGVDRTTIIPADLFVGKEAGDPCPHGHTNTFVTRRSNGARQFRCRGCIQERNAAMRERRRKAAA